MARSSPPIILDAHATELRTQFLDPFQRLDPRERAFVEAIANGLPTSQAGQIAGYKNPKKLSYRVLKRAHVANAVRHLAEQNRKAAQMDRKKVMQGFLEAIEMAKVQAEPAVMVAGWREVGRMCGLYEPEKKTLDVNVTAKRMIDKLETMTNEELLDYIEGEAEEVHPEPKDITPK